MAALKSESLSGLRAAVGREAAAAARVSHVLRGARRAMEALSPEKIEMSLAAASDCVEELGRCGSARISLTGLAARAAGLGPEAVLADVLHAFGTEGAGLGGEARLLSENLAEAAREVAAAGIVARYGAGICSHLASLGRAAAGSPAGYGPSGLLDGGKATRSHRA